MFKRKIYDKLTEWKHNSNGSTAMLIEGPRRVGKTTLAKEFAKNEYSSAIYIDFGHTDNQVLDIFRNYRSNTATLLRLLQVYFGTELKERDSVIIFDEVQRFPLAREEIKHLVEDGRFDYIETGSLVSIKKNSENIVIPSEEQRVRLNPLDFEEYLWACGKTLLANEIKNAYESRAPLPDEIHTLACRLFNEYMLVGGMPIPVQVFIDTGNYQEVDNAKQLILNLYDEDIEKFGGANADKARAIWRQIPGQLSGSSKRFQLSSTGKSSRSRGMRGALNWLEDSHTVNFCRRCTDPNIAFKLTADEDSFKIYMADTGLLVSHAISGGPEVNEIYRSLQFGNTSINKGMFVENAIAQQLRASGRELFYCTWNEPSQGLNGEERRPKPREIDFLISRGFSDAAGKLRLCPIEVKSGKRYSTVSLDDFKKRWPKRVGEEVVFHPKNLKVEGHRAYLPLYMAFCL